MYFHKIVDDRFYRIIYCYCTNIACFGHNYHYFNMQSVSNWFAGAKDYLVIPMSIFFAPQIRTKRMVFHVMFCFFYSEAIDFDIKYPYIYLFDISCDTWI